MWFAAKISKKVVLSTVPRSSWEAELESNVANAALVGANNVTGFALEVLLSVAMAAVFASGPFRTE